MDRAGLVLLVFPLYVDALPYLATTALATIAGRHREPAAQRLVAIVNSGFPETHQNSVAMAICREFAAQAGFTWAGGLALGGGGAIGGQPLTGAKRRGPTVHYVTAALDMTAAALSNGLPVPADAVRKIARSPIPFALWRPFYSWMADRSFRKLAAMNGIGKDKLLAKPYAA